MVQANTKIVIGVVPSFDSGDLIPPVPRFYAEFLGETAKNATNADRLYVRRNYLEAIRDAGATPLILHPEMPMDAIMELCDGVIIAGGADIDPSFYNRTRHENVIWTEPRERFEWEKELIETCDEYAKPIFGVCYGMQRLNVHYGGTLIQHIPSQVEHAIGHLLTTHDVTFNKSFLSFKGNQTYSVSARHSQALDDMADGFVVRAKTSDGIVEAIEGHGHFGVQWHPESDGNATQVYGAFIDYCRQQSPETLADFLPEASPA